jgi:hypothetical protein
MDRDRADGRLQIADDRLRIAKDRFPGDQRHVAGRMNRTSLKRKEPSHDGWALIISDKGQTDVEADPHIGSTGLKPALIFGHFCRG